MKKIVAIVVGLILIISIVGLTGCTESWQREMKTWQSEYSGGLDRVINIYSYTGELIRSVEGRVDVESNENKVLFDLNGKRYIYYNAVVEIIEK